MLASVPLADNILESRFIDLKYLFVYIFKAVVEQLIAITFRSNSKI